jgi:hypothetical protein
MASDRDLFGEDKEEDQPSNLGENLGELGSQVAKKRAADSAAKGGAAKVAAGGTAKAAGADIAADIAGDAAASAVAGGTSAATSAATTAASSAAAGANIAGAAVGELGGLKRAAEEGDGVGVVDAGVRTAAVAAGTYFGGGVGGAAVKVVLDTKAGRWLSRTSSKIVVAAVLLPVMAFAVAILLIVSLLASAIGAGGGAAAGAACYSGDTVPGAAVSSIEKQQIAADIMSVAYAKKLGKDGAVLGIMTALAESQLEPASTDLLQGSDTPAPLRSVGVFQQMPFYWANEFWPAGTTASGPVFLDAAYLGEAKSHILVTSYAAGKFFDKIATTPSLKGDKWKAMDPWVVAQTIQRSAFSDGSNYKAQLATAKSTVNLLVKTYPKIVDGKSVVVAAAAADNTATDGTADTCSGDLGAADGTYTIPLTGASTYFDGGLIYQDTAVAINRALLFVGNAGLACSDGMCLSKCDHLAGEVWGYSASGYQTAKDHWFYSVQAGIAHPNDRHPPLGALLFWDTGAAGHVATYVGSGMVVSNMTSGKSSNVYLMPADFWTKRAHYYGWAEPKFRGPTISGLGFTH